MIRRIKKAFVDNLPNLEWMDNKTPLAALEKVSVEVFILFGSGNGSQSATNVVLVVLVLGVVIRFSMY